MALQKALGDRAVACNVPDGYLRFSPHWHWGTLLHEDLRAYEPGAK